jgi:protein-tyrosine-phosphatase/DNA-binding transcriptional ArsR family regulator
MTIESMIVEANSAASRRAAIHAALADPYRVAIVDHLLLADASPSELQAQLSLPSNLLAHHLRVLQDAGVLRRTRSEADRRRTYLHLQRAALEQMMPAAGRDARRVVFVCTQNSARSQLAAAIWNRRSPVPATSAGTHPVEHMHPGAAAAARRRNLPLLARAPRHLNDVLAPGDLIIAVCDNAHEELGPDPARLHWSIPDPVRVPTADAFDSTVNNLAARIDHFAPCVRAR